MKYFPDFCGGPEPVPTPCLAPKHLLGLRFCGIFEDTRSNSLPAWLAAVGLGVPFNGTLRNKYKSVW